MKTIKVVNKKGEKFDILIDDIDFKNVSKFKWYVLRCANLCYATRVCYKTNKRIYLHRLLLNANSCFFVDHKDHNGLNNQRENIRLCTPSENSDNKRSNRGSSSAYKGVSKQIQTYKDKFYVRYIAHIFINKKLKHLGSFINEIDAAKAYDDAAISNKKTFANLNFQQA